MPVAAEMSDGAYGCEDSLFYAKSQSNSILIIAVLDATYFLTHTVLSELEYS